MHNVVVDELHHVPVNRTFACQDDGQLCLHEVWIPGHNDWVLGVKGGAAAVGAAALVALVLNATKVEVSFQPTDSPHFGASCPSGFAVAVDAAEVKPLYVLWPSFFRIPQHKYAVGQVEGHPVVVNNADGVGGKHEACEALLAKLVPREPFRLSLSPSVSRVCPRDDLCIVKILQTILASSRRLCKFSLKAAAAVLSSEPLHPETRPKLRRAGGHRRWRDGER